ncbi:Uncharacterised protein [Serratia plymuthica]|nr:Uncharacterised protein [Serratia plymuthica]
MTNKIIAGKAKIVRLSKTTHLKDKNVSTTEIKSEYKALLEFAINYRMDSSLSSGRIVNSQVRNAVETSMKRLVIAGQNSNMPPEKIKGMIIASSQQDRSHRNWKTRAGVEQRIGLLVGASRTMKVR